MRDVCGQVMNRTFSGHLVWYIITVTPLVHLDLHFDCHYIITLKYSRADAESSVLSRPKGVRCGNMHNNQHTSVIQERPAK